MKNKKPKTAATTADEKRKEDCKQLHDKLIETVEERELSNSESFDQAILAYSSGGLALSLTFLKDAVPFEESIVRPALYASWVGFILAIIAVIMSFVASQRGNKRQRELAKRYYLDDEDNAINESNNWAAAVEYLNDFAAVGFIIAVISATAFVGMNLDHKWAGSTKDINKSQKLETATERTASMSQDKGGIKHHEPAKPTPQVGRPVAPIQQKPPQPNKSGSGGSEK